MVLVFVGVMNLPLNSLFWQRKAISIECGYFSSAVITEEGLVFTFGRDLYGIWALNPIPGCINSAKNIELEMHAK